jgi:hypothetical protein
MSGLFSPKTPKIPEPVKPPTEDDALQTEEQLSRLRRRRGLASTFLMGRTSRAGAASQQLLGASGGGQSQSSGGAGGSGGPSGGRTIPQ